MSTRGKNTKRSVRRGVNTTSKIETPTDATVMTIQTDIANESAVSDMVSPVAPQRGILGRTSNSSFPELSAFSSGSQLDERDQTSPIAVLVSEATLATTVTKPTKKSPFVTSRKIRECKTRIASYINGMQDGFNRDWVEDFRRVISYIQIDIVETVESLNVQDKNTIFADIFTHAFDGLRNLISEHHQNLLLRSTELMNMLSSVVGVYTLTSGCLPFIIGNHRELQRCISNTEILRESIVETRNCAHNTAMVITNGFAEFLIAMNKTQYLSHTQQKLINEFAAIATGIVSDLCDAIHTIGIRRKETHERLVQGGKKVRHRVL